MNQKVFDNGLEKSARYRVGTVLELLVVLGGYVDCGHVIRNGHPVALRYAYAFPIFLVKGTSIEPLIESFALCELRNHETQKKVKNVVLCPKSRI